MGEHNNKILFSFFDVWNDVFPIISGFIVAVIITFLTLRAMLQIAYIAVPEFRYLVDNMWLNKGISEKVKAKLELDDRDSVKELTIRYCVQVVTYIIILLLFLYFMPNIISIAGNLLANIVGLIESAIHKQ